MTNIDETEAYHAFKAYAEAKARVEETMHFADAMAAGRAWRHFLNLFAEPDDHMPLDANIIPFPKKARR